MRMNGMFTNVRNIRRTRRENSTHHRALNVRHRLIRTPRLNSMKIKRTRLLDFTRNHLIVIDDRNVLRIRSTLRTIRRRKNSRNNLIRLIRISTRAGRLRGNMPIIHLGFHRVVRRLNFNRTIGLKRIRITRTNFREASELRRALIRNKTSTRSLTNNLRLNTRNIKNENRFVGKRAKRFNGSVIRAELSSNHTTNRKSLI